MRNVHLLLAFLLVIFHGIFLFRGLYLRNHDLGPRWIDRMARLISHLGLPLITITGITLLGTQKITPLLSLHVMIGLLPFLVILGFTPFLGLKRRIPWLLPSINLALFFLAFVLGWMISH